MAFLCLFPPGKLYQTDLDILCVICFVVQQHQRFSAAKTPSKHECKPSERCWWRAIKHKRFFCQHSNPISNFSWSGKKVCEPSLVSIFVFILYFWGGLNLFINALQLFERKPHMSHHTWKCYSMNGAASLQWKGTHVRKHTHTQIYFWGSRLQGVNDKAVALSDTEEKARGETECSNLPHLPFYIAIDLSGLGLTAQHWSPLKKRSGARGSGRSCRCAKRQMTDRCRHLSGCRMNLTFNAWLPVSVPLSEYR